MFAYEYPTNCEVTIKRTIEERKGAWGWNRHLGECIWEAFYISENFLKMKTKILNHAIIAHKILPKELKWVKVHDLPIPLSDTEYSNSSTAILNINTQ